MTMLARPWLLTALLLAPTLAAQDDREALAIRLDEQFAKAFPDDEPGAAVIVTKAGQTILRKGYGLANVELGVRVDPAQTFCLASGTKPFTAMAVLALVEDGKLSLPDRAADLLPELELDQRITIEHLLGHRSGLPDFDALPEFGDAHLQEAIEPAALCLAAKSRELSFAPGDRYHYCNINYALLARIVELRSGRTWEQFLGDRITGPAEMQRTLYAGHDRIVPGLVSGYTKTTDGWRRARAISMTRGYGLGGLCSTVDDLARWHDALVAGKLLAPATVLSMQTAPELADGSRSEYALGWRVRNVRGHEFVYHPGGIDGWVAMLVRIPAAQVFVAVLSNRDDDANPAPKLAMGAAALVAAAK